MSPSSTLPLPPQGWSGTETPALRCLLTSSEVDQWCSSCFLGLKRFSLGAQAPEALAESERLQLNLARPLIPHTCLLTVDNWSFKMQSHYAVCALDHGTASGAGSSHCSLDVSLGISMPGSPRLELPNTFSGEKGKYNGRLPVKIKCFEKEHVIKAVDILGISQQTKPVGFLWEACTEGSDNLGLWDVAVCKPHL